MNVFFYFSAYDEKQIQKRKEIESRPIFDNGIPGDSPSSSKGQDVKQNLVKSIALRKGSPFDNIKTTTNNSEQFRKLLGVRKRSIDKNTNLDDDLSKPKQSKGELFSCEVNGLESEKLKINSLNSDQKTISSCSTDDKESENVSKDLTIQNSSDKLLCDTKQNLGELNVLESTPLDIKSVSSSALGLVSAYTDSESECSEG